MDASHQELLMLAHQAHKTLMQRSLHQHQDAAFYQALFLPHFTALQWGFPLFLGHSCCLMQTRVDSHEINKPYNK